MSRKVVHRLYMDFEREERWLNAMAGKGWHFVRYTVGRYHFEQGEPGAWIYRIELLPGEAGSDESEEYVSLLEDAGVERVSTYMRWVYLRRPAAEGPFELFSDLESRIGHYRRVLKLLTTALLSLVGCAGALFVVSNESGGLAYTIPMAIIGVAIVLLVIRALALWRRVSSLDAQRLIHE